MKKLLIFASGSKDSGGSGFENLVQASRNGVLEADIVGVVSNYEHGGVRLRAEKLGVPFVYFSGPFVASEYKKIVKEHNADFVTLSGWLKLVAGLDPAHTINIHPGQLPRFGGKGLYGHFVHEAVMEAFGRGEVFYSAVTMHFVTEKYDEGPIFFQYAVPILKNDSSESLGKRVNETEREFQPWVTDLVVRGEISWDGEDPKTLKVPSWYLFHKNLDQSS